MRSRIIALLEYLNASYWFIPAVMASAALVLALVTIGLDRQIDMTPTPATELFFTDSPEAARTTLSAIAGSMITVAGTVFSLTMVVLSLTSQQHGPLTLNNFMRDRANQFVLGTFTATFVYCLLVLQSVEDESFVPTIATTIGLGLALFSLAVLIYFIHHVSDSIQAFRIIEGIGYDLMAAIKRLFPEAAGVASNETTTLPENFDPESFDVPVPVSGYIQVVDEQELLEIAEHFNIIIKMIHRPGHFVLQGNALVKIWPGKHVSEGLIHQIHETVTIGGRRTQAQDVMLLFEQLVSMAVRALSPGVNDPFTAMMCIDRLLEALAGLATRDLPTGYRHDRNGNLRIVTDAIRFEEAVRVAFDEIRHYGSSDPKVMWHLMGGLHTLLLRIDDYEHRQVLYDYAETLWKHTQNSLRHPWELEAIEAHYRQIVTQMPR